MACRNRQVNFPDADIIVRDMINAAKVGGAIDQVELQKIVGKPEEAGLNQEESEFFMTDSAKSMYLEGVITLRAEEPIWLFRDSFTSGN